MYSSHFGGFEGIIFQILPFAVTGVFLIVFAMIIINLVQGAKEWKKNNESPILTVDAAIKAKRSKVDFCHHNHNTGIDNMSHTHMSSTTTYYVTFEVSSGSRMEFSVRGTEYGMLAENDIGKLTFQGTRYLGFERKPIGGDNA